MTRATGGFLPPKTGAQGVKGDTGAQGPAGTLPPTTGRLVFIGNVTVAETLLISLSAGNKRMTLPLAGVATTDRLLLTPNGVPSTGCEAINAYPTTTAGQVSVGYSVPLLSIGATYSIPVSIYKVT